MSPSGGGMEITMSEQNEMNMNIEELVKEAPVSDAPVVEENVCESCETVEETPVVAAFEEEDEVPVYVEPVFAEGFWGNCHRVLHKGWRWVKKTLHIPDLTKKQKAMVWDKITTGLLILLFCTPVLVLIYILLWFVTK